jgi:hypothetical protein
VHLEKTSETLVKLQATSRNFIHHWFLPVPWSYYIQWSISVAELYHHHHHHHHLRWNFYVNHISARATRVLNLLRRNIYSCSADTKALAYTSLVRPHLEFALAAWDPYTESDSNKLDKVQRRAARFVNREYRRNASVSQMMSRLGWESLAICLRRRTIRLSLFYKGLHGLAPIPVN